MSLAPPSTSAASASAGGASTKDSFNAALRSRNANNNYIAHLKIWETLDEGAPPNSAAAAAPQRKARYLVLAVQRDSGRVTLNKAKRNANGSFSIGKDWDVNTLRAVEVLQPDAFTLTLSRSYSWQTERPREQTLFLQSLVKVYRKYTRDAAGPRCVGLEVDSGSTAPAPAPAPAAAITQRAASPAPSNAPSLSLDTAVPRERSRDSPARRLGSAGGAGGAPASDGFYDPRTRAAAESSAPASPLDSPRRPLQAPLPRPAMSRSNSSRGPADGAPAIVLPDSRNGTPPPAATVEPRTPRRERSPLANAASLPDDVPPARHVPGARELAVPAAAPAGRTSPAAGEGSDASSVTEVQTKAPAPLARRPSKGRSGSGDGGSSLGVPSSGGDARARLSAVEPIRGGAAYERMLLAGTGLSGVTEGDEEEDPYGGAELEDADVVPSPFKPPPLSRPRGLRQESEEKRNTAGGEDDDEEDTTLLNVEEILEGFEWRGGALKRAGKGTADVIEARLLDELAALDAANIHAIIESDDRVNLVVRHMEEALSALDMMDSMIAGFKVQLNARADDISHIESQNRGLQVHTSNQRTLANEIEKLLSTVHVDDEAVGALQYAGLADDVGIADAERAAASLYKAMLQARRTDEERADGSAEMMMAAATERLEEYEGLAESFAKRMLLHLTREFNEQAQLILNDPQRRAALAPPHPTLHDHSAVEEILGRYCGLLLWAKEVSPGQFSRISAAYFASANDRYRKEISQLFGVWRELVRVPAEDELAESSFILPAGASSTATLRSGTIRRPGGPKASNKGGGGGDVSGGEAFQHLLSSVVPLIMREEAFMADMLHINDTAVTYADYMALEPYFRRRAAAIFGSEALNLSGPLREMKGALDLIFSFLMPEWQNFADAAIGRDRTQIVGILAALDRAIVEAEQVSSEFLVRSLSKLHMRLAAMLERFIADQIKGIEQTKLTVKKRKGVAHFIRVFPAFVERIESQLADAQTLNIRAAVDGYYEQLCRTMFEVLQAMAKMDVGGLDEDKSALNHHVILIENMHHFVADVSKQTNPALVPLVQRAEGIYEDHKAAYVQAVLRRPLGKMMDFGDGIDALLRSTPANEVSLHSAYSRSAFKRLAKEHTAKDVRKAIEVLSRRVQKHFGLDDDDAAAAQPQDLDEAADVLARVWKACEEAAVREAERQQRIARDCYAGGVAFELSTEDVRRPFAANAPSAGRRR